MENKTSLEADELGLNEPTSLEDISNQLSSIESELLSLNEKADRKGGNGAVLFFILLVLIYIAIK